MAEAKETSQSKGKKVNAASTTVPLTDILFLTLRRWPWLLLSIAICVGAAYFHLLRTPDVYTRSADILVKDDYKGTTVGNDEFADFGLFGQRSNLPNEITAIKAKDLMEEVVRRLGLDITYNISGRFHDISAYGYNLPVKLTVAGYPDEKTFSLNLLVSPGGKVTLKNLSAPERSGLAKEYTGKLGEAIKTPLGKFTVSKTPDYIKGEEIELKVNKIPLTSARDSYNGRLGVEIKNEKGSVLTLTMSDQNTQRADEVLATVINVYNENWMRDRNQIAVSTSNFINDRLGVIEGELGSVDANISSYKSANLIPDVQAAAGMYMGQSQQNQASMLELGNQLQMARYIRNYMSSEANRDQLLPANTGLASSDVQTLISDYNDKLLQRQSLVAKSSEKNPLVGQIDEQLGATRNAIVRTIDNEIVGLNTQLRSVRSSEAQTMSRIASNPTQAKNLLSVERQQKVKESLYLFLLQKREENELTQAFTAYNTRLVNKPGPGGAAPTPDRGRILAIAFLIGLALPFGFTYAQESMNTKVRGRKDIENLSLPFLGEIPQYYGNRVKDGSFGQEKEVRAIVVKPGSRDVVNEAFRVLRTNLEFMKVHKDGCNVIAMTSFNPGSGKSFLTMNLAVALAIKKKRVLVIDGDLRHGSTSAYVDSPEDGLSSYLAGQINVLNSLLITDKEYPNMQILPIGTPPPNPTELLESQAFGELIEQLRKQYDYIFIDCPPIEVVADAQIIDKYVDRTVFVVRAGILERMMLPQLERIFEERKFQNMAMILNGTRHDTGRYGYSHGYRYGYGYGYGYGIEYGGGDDSESSQKRKVRKVKHTSGWLQDE